MKRNPNFDDSCRTLPWFDCLSLTHFYGERHAPHVSYTWHNSTKARAEHLQPLSIEDASLESLSPPSVARNDADACTIVDSNVDCGSSPPP